MKNILPSILMVVLITVLITGCTTMPMTDQKRPENVTLVVTDVPAPSKNGRVKLSLVEEGITVARYVGNIVLTEISKKYDGSYSRTILDTNAVALVSVGGEPIQASDGKGGMVTVMQGAHDARVLNKRLVFQRYVHKDLAVSFDVDLVPIVVPNSEISYVQIQPRSLNFVRSKAKMTRFLYPILKADRIDLTVDITLVFPNANQEDGLNTYHYNFTIRNVRAGDMVPVERYVSPVYEVPSDGPMIVDIQFTENNRMSGMLKSLANVVK